MSKKQPLSELIGVRFHYLVILDEAISNNAKHRKVKAKCDCGKIKDYHLGNLKRGLTLSCGCYNISVTKDRIAKGLWVKKSISTHGLIKHPLYGVWAGMKDRCNNKNCKYYHRYGGRGVRICDEWASDFKVFYDWAMANGWEQGLEIDKDIKAKELGVDPLLYSPEMCCFVTEKINCRNRESNVFYEYNGMSKTIPEWAEVLGFNKDVFYKRIGKLKWSVEKAFSTPLINNKLK
jgi:hypothetical protein